MQLTIDDVNKDDDLPPDGLMNNGESSEDEGQLDNHAGIAVKNFDYSTLRVSPDMKQLFDLIGTFQPITVELETKLKPPIPDYYPAIGDVDYFLKVLILSLKRITK